MLAEETIITWSDAEIGTDVALSFQEADGCNSVWYAAQRRLHTASRPLTCLRATGRVFLLFSSRALAVTALYAGLVRHAASW